ncbi:glycoside hydrolase family 35 protein [Paenibacillus sp. WLX1005]|uniref:glycoside hydrolase family 35 protein n=1 Tax=Paenibacillus sp. WLX1005 TaxID=3243766 RepID=UPI003984118C
MGQFEIKGNDFVYDEQPIRILSGALHYFRIVPEYWEDRLLKLKACGLNTVETYVPWNLHEPVEGNFVFTGLADLEGFVTLAGRLGLHVIVRPSPYICAEWEFGGLPAWLLHDHHLRLRTADPAYLSKVDAYYDVLLPILRQLLCTNGGPIIALQIENEYGSYGSDTVYLEYIRDAMIQRGMDVLLFTSDGPEHFMLQGGMIPGVLATVNFGSGAREGFELLQQYQPHAPLMVMEFWDGWFDHWMEPHQTRSAEDTAQAVREIMDCGASLNLYMFHGGTNFGFYNGANHIQQYEPTVGSYDYDALLDESGRPTAKFYAVREVLEAYMELPPLELPEHIPSHRYGEVQLTQYALLDQQLDVLSTPVYSSWPEPMEKLGQAYGYILYTANIPGPREEMELHLPQLADRAQVWIDGQYLGTVERWNPKPLLLAIPKANVQLDILVENMGRINYGPLLHDPKGLVGGVRHGNQYVHNWIIRPLPLDQLDHLQWSNLRMAATSPWSFIAEPTKGTESALTEPYAVPSFATDSQAPTNSELYHREYALQAAHAPVFYRGVLQVEQPQDTFLRTDGWGKGIAYINGFHLGRYWQAGPQRTLYIPAPLLRIGDNELILFELHGCEQPIVTLTDTPDLG